MSRIDQEARKVLEQFAWEQFKDKVRRAMKEIAGMKTLNEVFDACELCLSPGYESFHHLPISGTTDMYWFRYDPNGTSEGKRGIQLLDDLDAFLDWRQSVGVERRTA